MSSWNKPYIGKGTGPGVIYVVTNGKEHRVYSKPGPAKHLRTYKKKYEDEDWTILKYHLMDGEVVT